MADRADDGVRAPFDREENGYNVQQVEQHLKALRGDGDAAGAAAAILERAQRVGEQAVAAARSSAEDLSAAAQANAARTVKEAQDEAKAIADTAEQNAARRIAEVDRQVATLDERIQQLIQQRDKLAETVTAFAEDLVAAVKQAKAV